LRHDLSSAQNTAASLTSNRRRRQPFARGAAEQPALSPDFDLTVLKGEIASPQCV
jgi:hypothetical protein